MKKTSESSNLVLNKALKAFEATEANINKLERLWEQLKQRIPKGIVFGSDPEHEDLIRHFHEIARILPTIDGRKLEARPLNLNEIAQFRMDAAETGEFESKVWAEEQIYIIDSELREYRFQFNRKRRDSIRTLLEKKISEIDSLLSTLEKLLEGKLEPSTEINDENFKKLRTTVHEIDTLLGSSVTRPPRWSDLNRHLYFAMPNDLKDIITIDWPSVKEPLVSSLIGENKPIPVDIQDLNEIVIPKSSTFVIAELKWNTLNDEGFERLLYNLISDEDGYENPQWLTHPNAPDRGRDLSVERVIVDKLAGTARQRVIIQCKHWVKKSISIDDIASLREQISLWEPPRVDICIIATSGRFTSDAVAMIEKNNQSDRALKIEMWPNSHLERLLASRPGLIAEFGLR